MSTTPHRVVLCPGQGAQVVNMGKAWYQASPEARAIFDLADTILANRLGSPLTTLCFEGPADRLNQTNVSQPAIYVASIACWRGLLARWSAGAGGTAGIGGTGAKEAAVIATAGLSLGEYSALHIAGAFTFEHGLELVTLRGKAMQEAADAVKLPDGSPGSGMVAIIGADESQVVELCAKSLAQGPGNEVLVPANFNAPGQIVISGSIAACKRAVEIAAGMSLRASPLPVAGAFHSALMQPAAERLHKQLAQTPIHAPVCKVMSNVTGKPHEPLPGMSIEDSIRTRLVEQLTHPVRWQENCSALAQDHATVAAAEFIELCPGKTLAGLYRRIDKAVKVQAFDEP